MQMKKIVFLFSIAIILWIFPFYEQQCMQRIVVIDPAGDAKRTGRRIGDNFERGLTLQCAEKIKELIEAQVSYIKVIITRMPGDIVYDLQNASLANRIDADLFINLNFYHAHETKPILFLYQCSYGDDFASCSQGLVCNTYDQAYRINKIKTDSMTHMLKKVLSNYNNLFVVHGPHSVPIKPLLGIVAPSIAIEAGLKHKELWTHYCEPIARGIIGALDEKS
jgi:N-acetylmuramoyl-L-alanine amidase